MLDGDIAKGVAACPFCACTTIKHRDDGDSGWLECDWCGATGPYSSEDAAANLTIEQAWNKRIEYPETCPHCQGSGESVADQICPTCDGKGGIHLKEPS